MLDIGWQELFIVGILALLVIGPKDLPRALKTIMHWVRKARGLAREFQSGVDELVREAELDDLKREMNSATRDVGKQIEDSVDPTGLDKDMDMSAVERDLDKAVKDATDPDKESKGAKPAKGGTADSGKDASAEGARQQSTDAVKTAIADAAPDTAGAEDTAENEKASAEGSPSKTASANG